MAYGFGCHCHHYLAHDIAFIGRDKIGMLLKCDFPPASALWLCMDSNERRDGLLYWRNGCLLVLRVSYSYTVCVGNRDGTLSAV
jgi:hypothetical protein